MKEHDFKALAWRMAFVYLGVHLALVLVCYAGMRLSFREHLTAFNWALPGVAVGWLSLRVTAPLYRKPGYRRWLSIPLIGVYARLLPLLIPMMVVSGMVVIVGDSIHPNSLWMLFALIGIYAATFYGQDVLIREGR